MLTHIRERKLANQLALPRGASSGFQTFICTVNDCLAKVKIDRTKPSQFSLFVSLSAKDRVAEKSNDHRRWSKVSADLQPGHLLPGDPEALQLRRRRLHLQSQERPGRSHRLLQAGGQAYVVQRRLCMMNYMNLPPVSFQQAWDIENMAALFSGAGNNRIQLSTWE